MKNKHHILFQRQEWTLRPEAEELRNTSTLIPELDYDAHNALHRECSFVPTLGFYTLRHVIREFEEGRNTMQSMDRLMRSIEDAARHPRATEIEQAIAELAVHAIDIQRPYIDEDRSKFRLVV